MTAPAHNPRRFLVQGCRGLIGPGVPVLRPEPHEELQTGLVTGKTPDGQWAVHGDLIGVFSNTEIAVTVARLSGRIRCATWLYKALERRMGATLTVDSLGPSWCVVGAVGNTFELSGAGWLITFDPNDPDRWDPKQAVGNVQTRALLDLAHGNDVPLPDGSSTNAALALKLACEQLGAGG